MAEPPENTLIHTFVYVLRHTTQLPYPYIRDLSILLIPSKSLRFSICTVLIQDLSFFFHNIVSLPYIKTGTSNVSCKTLVHSSCKSLALTRDQMAPAYLLPLVTFLPNSAASVPYSFKTHPKYLNSEMCSKRIPST